MDNIKNKVVELIDIALKNKDDYLIIVLGNVKNITTDFRDYNATTSIVAEYYTLTQFNTIVKTLNKYEFETLCYFDEIDFIHDYLSKIIRNNYPKKFIVLNFAQKGLVQGRKSLIPVFCEMNNIIHTNSNGFASSLAREKYFWQLCLDGLFTVPKSWIYHHKYGWLNGNPDNGLKVIAKLTNQASSIGLSSSNSVFKYNENHDDYIKNLSNEYQDDVLVQEFISGREVEVPIYYDGKEAFCLPPCGIAIGGSDYLQDKILYNSIRCNQGFARFNFDNNYPILSKDLQTETIKIVKLLNMQGICRIDYRIDDNNIFYVMDINCNPHLTETSCISKSIGYLNLEKLDDNYDEMLLSLIGLTINRHPN